MFLGLPIQTWTRGNPTHPTAWTCGFWSTSDPCNIGLKLKTDPHICRSVSDLVFTSSGQTDLTVWGLKKKKGQTEGKRCRFPLRLRYFTLMLITPHSDSLITKAHSINQILASTASPSVSWLTTQISPSVPLTDLTAFSWSQSVSCSSSPSLSLSLSLTLSLVLPRSSWTRHQTTDEATRRST